MIASCFRETFKLSDGGHICLDWCNEKDGDIPDNESCRPTVIIFPGTAGEYEQWISVRVFEWMTLLQEAVTRIMLPTFYMA